MSESERSPSPADSGDKNGTRNGGDDYRDKSKERSRRRSASGSDNESRSRSRSKSRHSKKRKSHRRSRSGSRDRRSRSRSPRRSHKKRSRTRSRSRSRSPVRDRRSRRYSRSPGYGRPKFSGTREAPPPSRCLGVFGMSTYTDEKQLDRFFSQFGKLEAIQIVYDRKTGRSRGFAFVYFERVDDAVTAKERAVNTEIDGQRVRIDFSITEGPHAPTPGMYMGSRRDGPRGYGGGGRIGGSPSYRRRRSRSGSYSPRR